MHPYITAEYMHSGRWSLDRGENIQTQHVTAAGRSSRISHIHHYHKNGYASSEKLDRQMTQKIEQVKRESEVPKKNLQGVFETWIDRQNHAQKIKQKVV